MELLCEYDFGIQYKPGKENLVADALSRKSTLSAISITTSQLIDKVRQYIFQDSYFSKIRLLLQISTPTPKQRQRKGYTLDDTDLYFNNRFCIPHNKDLKLIILRDAHDIPITAHPGYIKMYHS